MARRAKIFGFPPRLVLAALPRHFFYRLLRAVVVAILMVGFWWWLW